MTRKSRKFVQGAYTPAAGYIALFDLNNGPVRYVCILCKKNYIDAHTEPKHCDACLSLNIDEAKAIIGRIHRGTKKP